MSGAAGIKRILVSDPVGEAGAVVARHASDWNAEVRVFRQEGLLARHAAQHGADLFVVFRPDTLDFLERLHDDARTRHVPLLLVATELLRDPESAYAALACADQVISYPFEEAQLVPWIDAALRRDFRRGPGQEYAEARVRLPGTAHWTGRVSWVSGNRLRFETDLVLAEGEVLPFESPLLAELGESSAPARVVARSREDMHYNHEVRLVLELDRPKGAPPLSARVRGNPDYEAPGKLKVAVVTAEPENLRRFADAVDRERVAVRWIPSLDNFQQSMARHVPALLVVDPEHPQLEEPLRAGAVVRLTKNGPRVLPLSSPPSTRFWDRLGDACPGCDVPPLADGAEWTALVLRWAAPDATDADANRVFLRRDHPFSHGRLVAPATLVALTEATGAIESPYALGERARGRLELPGLADAGVPPLYARALGAARKGESAKLVWMGIGDEESERRLRFFIYETIVAARRRELEGS